MNNKLCSTQFIRFLCLSWKLHVHRAQILGDPWPCFLHPIPGNYSFDAKLSRCKVFHPEIGSHLDLFRLLYLNEFLKYLDPHPFLPLPPSLPNISIAPSSKVQLSPASWFRHSCPRRNTMRHMHAGHQSPNRRWRRQLHDLTLRPCVSPGLLDPVDGDQTRVPRL